MLEVQGSLHQLSRRADFRRAESLNDAAGLAQHHASMFKPPGYLQHGVDHCIKKSELLICSEQCYNSGGEVFVKSRQPLNEVGMIVAQSIK